MDFTDKTLVCSDCQAEFVYTAADQQRHKERGYEHEPKRCPECRSKRRAATGVAGGGHAAPRGDRGGSHGGGPRPVRKFFPATCAECGRQTEVPFKPTEGRPVFCRDCFQSKRP